MTRVNYRELRKKLAVEAAEDAAEVYEKWLKNDLKISKDGDTLDLTFKESYAWFTKITAIFLQDALQRKKRVV